MKKNDEEYLQIFIASFLNKLSMEYPDNFVFWHTPNGSKRSKAEAGKFKMMGLLSGVPDLCVMGNGNNFHFIELKKGAGRLSPTQEKFIKSAIGFGFKVSIVYCDTPKEAVQKVGSIMNEYFKIPHQGISKASESALSFIKE